MCTPKDDNFVAAMAHGQACLWSDKPMNLYASGRWWCEVKCNMTETQLRSAFDADALQDEVFDIFHKVNGPIEKSTGGFDKMMDALTDYIDRAYDAFGEGPVEDEQEK